MKKESLKEFGKFGLDLSKITFAVAILPTLLKKGSINDIALIAAMVFLIGGLVFINKGAKDDE